MLESYRFILNITVNYKERTINKKIGQNGPEKMNKNNFIVPAVTGCLSYRKKNELWGHVT